MAQNQEIVDLTNLLRNTLSKPHVTQEEVYPLVYNKDGYLLPAFTAIASTDPKAPLGAGNDDAVQGADMLLASLKNMSTSPEDNSEAISLMAAAIAHQLTSWVAPKPKGLVGLLHKSDAVTLRSFLGPVLDEAARVGHLANFGAVFKAVPAGNKEDVAGQYLGNFSSYCAPDLDKPNAGTDSLDEYMAKAAILNACLSTPQDLDQLRAQMSASLGNQNAQEQAHAEAEAMSSI